MSNDIENLLRSAEAPAMGVDPQHVIAGATRTRRRRRTAYGAMGLAAALVVGAGIGVEQAGRRADPAPATSTAQAVGKLFRQSSIGDGRVEGYVVSLRAGQPQVRRVAPGSAPLRLTQNLPGGVKVFRDGTHTVVITPLPLAADDAEVVFADGANVGSTTGGSLRLTGTLAVEVSVTEKPGAVRAVIWNIGSTGYSTTGERAQVASFPDARVYWYPRLDQFGLQGSQIGSLAAEPPKTGYVAVSGGSGTDYASYFAVGVPHGARNIALKPGPGIALPTAQVRQLGTSAYDIVYVRVPAKAAPHGSIVRSVTWTDGSGTHTRAFE